MNKAEFKSIASSIEREGIQDLLNWLETTDFYTAPASVRYHNSFEGGLCAHSLNVYHNMVKLRDTFCPELSDESVKLVSLFHDLAKVNFYEETVQNKKVYSQTGSKSDEMGRFDWVAVKGYKVKSDMDKMFVCSTHGVNSYMLLHRFVKLAIHESAAIMNHHSGMDDGMAVKDMSEITNRYPILAMLHMADYLSTYVTENPYIVDE